MCNTKINKLYIVYYLYIIYNKNEIKLFTSIYNTKINKLYRMFIISILHTIINMQLHYFIKLYRRYPDITTKIYMMMMMVT